MQCDCPFSFFIVAFPDYLCTGYQKYQVMGKYTYKPQFGVIVICTDEKEQKAVYDRLHSEGLTLKVVNV